MLKLALFLFIVFLPIHSWANPDWSNSNCESSLSPKNRQVKSTFLRSISRAYELGQTPVESFLKTAVTFITNTRKTNLRPKAILNIVNAYDEVIRARISPSYQLVNAVLDSFFINGCFYEAAIFADSTREWNDIDSTSKFDRFYFSLVNNSRIEDAADLIQSQIEVGQIPETQIRHFMSALQFPGSSRRYTSSIR
jgi:hypothetical protein